jgi:hypothetical protein
VIIVPIVVMSQPAGNSGGSGHSSETIVIYGRGALIEVFTPRPKCSRRCGRGSARRGRPLAAAAGRRPGAHQHAAAGVGGTGAAAAT